MTSIVVKNISLEELRKRYDLSKFFVRNMQQVYLNNKPFIKYAELIPKPEISKKPNLEDLVKKSLPNIIEIIQLIMLSKESALITVIEQTQNANQVIKKTYYVIRQNGSINVYEVVE